MTLELFSGNATKTEKRLTGKSTADLLQLELDLYKKLLHFFHAGDYYYYIYNSRNYAFDLVSKEAETVLGYQPSAITPEFIMEQMHPDDRPWVLSFENRTDKFLEQLSPDKLMKYKASYDFRLKRSDGGYMRILQQVAVVQTNPKGTILRTLGIHTDITHLKPAGRPAMSLIGMEGEPSYPDITVKNAFIESKEILTRREKEILRLLIAGKLSKEISDMLSISKQTVDTHRKNMLQKNRLNNTRELIVKATREGWI